jgi:hypothetical protein
MSIKVDWKKHLEENPDFVVLNKQMAKSYGKIDSEKISKKKEKEVLDSVDDKFKIILLQFFKDILHSEGFESIEYIPIGPSQENYTGLICKIKWSNGKITSGIGDAHYCNTNSFAKYYLGPIAENRSFVRAVKAYFNISMLGADEIGEIPKEEPSVSLGTPTGPIFTLRKISKEKLSISSFEDFKKFLRLQIKNHPDQLWIKPEEYENWSEYDDWSNITKLKAVELISKIKSINNG